MALPDLDTSDIEWIAFWNFLDNGGTSIDPLEATSAMSNYQEYTNGVEGLISMGFSWATTRSYGCRVKDDGWIVVWLSRTPSQEGTNLSTSADVHGPFDAWDARNGTVQNADRTTLSDAIQDLKLALSNEAEATFNHADAGLYNYAEPDATTITVLSNVEDGSGSTMTTTPSASTGLYWGWVQGRADSLNYDDSGTYWARQQENIELAYEGNDGNSWGVREVVSRGEITPGETVESRVYANRGGSHYGTQTLALAWA